MAIDKLPPEVDGNDLKRSLEKMYDYLFYLREQTNYELARLERNQGGIVNDI